LNANTIIHEKVYLLEGAISVARDKSVPRAVRATVLASLLESHDRSVRFSAWEGLLMILDSQDAYANVSSWENVVLKGKDRGTGKGIKKLLGFISSHRTSINDADDGPWHLGQRKHRD
jgi:hypothetical protein